MGHQHKLGKMATINPLQHVLKSSILLESEKGQLLYFKDFFWIQMEEECSSTQEKLNLCTEIVGETNLGRPQKRVGAAQHVADLNLYSSVVCKIVKLL